MNQTKKVILAIRDTMGVVGIALLLGVNFVILFSTNKTFALLDNYLSFTQPTAEQLHSTYEFSLSLLFMSAIFFVIVSTGYFVYLAAKTVLKHHRRKRTQLM